jgi:uncharacterized membrane protein YedE/YeeE
MRSIYRVLFEAIVVGIIIIGLLFIVHPLTSGKMLTTKTNGFRSMVVGGFLVGFIGHILLEVVGANEAFCKNAKF